MSLNVEVLEKTFNQVKPHANEFAASFYENFFQTYPEIKPLFNNTDLASQQKKLFNSLVLVVENLRNPEALSPVFKALGARHVGYGVIPKYYGPMGEVLLMTFEQYLKEDWTPEAKKAWLDAFTAITKLMLSYTVQESSPKVIQAENPTILTKSPSLNAETTQKSQSSESKAELDKKTLISTQPFSKIVKQRLSQFIDAFWTAPTWLVVLISTLIFTVFVVIADDNSVLADVIDSADSISLVIAVVVFIKEAPDRRKQFHYQAWSTIDTAHNVKVSYARILALQDLNQDAVPLKGLDAPGAELTEIILPHANLSKANLFESDLTNANLTYANLDNANLSQAKLSGANLSHAKLGFANLSQANLSSVNLNSANLICTNLSNANLSGADLRDTNLSGANLEGAYLTGANLKNAKVSDHELRNAFLEGAIMPNGSKYSPQN